MEVKSSKPIGFWQLSDHSDKRKSSLSQFSCAARFGFNDIVSSTRDRIRKIGKVLLYLCLRTGSN